MKIILRSLFVACCMITALSGHASDPTDYLTLEYSVDDIRSLRLPADSDQNFPDYRTELLARLMAQGIDPLADPKASFELDGDVVRITQSVDFLREMVKVLDSQQPAGLIEVQLFLAAETFQNGSRSGRVRYTSQPFRLQSGYPAQKELQFELEPIYTEEQARAILPSGTSFTSLLDVISTLERSGIVDMKLDIQTPGNALFGHFDLRSEIVTVPMTLFSLGGTRWSEGEVTTELRWEMRVLRAINSQPEIDDAAIQQFFENEEQNPAYPLQGVSDSIRDFFIKAGIVFDSSSGAGVLFTPESLIIRERPETLNRIRQIMRRYEMPGQVELTTEVVTPNRSAGLFLAVLSGRTGEVVFTRNHKLADDGKGGAGSGLELLVTPTVEEDKTIDYKQGFRIKDFQGAAYLELRIESSSYSGGSQGLATIKCSDGVGVPGDMSIRSSVRLVTPDSQLPNKGLSRLTTEFYPISRHTIDKLCDPGVTMNDSRDPFAPVDPFGPSMPSSGPDDLEEACKQAFIDQEVAFSDEAALAFDGTQFIITQTAENHAKILAILRKLEYPRVVSVSAAVTTETMSAAVSLVGLSGRTCNLLLKGYPADGPSNGVQFEAIPSFYDEFGPTVKLELLVRNVNGAYFTLTTIQRDDEMETETLFIPASDSSEKSSFKTQVSVERLPVEALLPGEPQ